MSCLLVTRQRTASLLRRAPLGVDGHRAALEAARAVVCCVDVESVGREPARDALHDRLEPGGGLGQRLCGSVVDDEGGQQRRAHQLRRQEDAAAPRARRVLFHIPEPPRSVEGRRVDVGVEAELEHVPLPVQRKLCRNLQPKPAQLEPGLALPRVSCRDLCLLHRRYPVLIPVQVGEHSHGRWDVCLHVHDAQALADSASASLFMYTISSSKNRLILGRKARKRRPFRSHCCVGNDAPIPYRLARTNGCAMCASNWCESAIPMRTTSTGSPKCWYESWRERKRACRKH
mmetsp:Transcript_54462/g.128533  ORF Transcript_54462/g.128533 Transcript_54462/m.128533 type:complete len:288 (+) Transcript_54462:527-1390(+)